LQGGKNQALAPLLHHLSSLISIRCHEVTFPSRDNCNQVVYNFHQTMSRDHVIVIDLWKQKKLIRESSGAKDTIKDINAASIAHMFCLSYSVIMLRPKHFQALPYSFQVICSTRTTSYGSMIIRLLFSRPY